MPAKPVAPITVCSLLGSRQTDLAITCLGSLQRFSAEPVHFQLHDDGSLQDHDIDRLNQGLNRPSLVKRKEADERMASFLASYPVLTRVRSKNPFLLKLLDTVLLSDREEIAFCDTDIYFLRPFSGLFRFPSATAGSCFMMDLQNAYSVRSWHILQYGLRLPRRLNSGLILFRKSQFDLDLMEWFFGRSNLHAAYHWVEQTAWGLLGGATECWFYDVDQVDIVPETGPLPRADVALHFTSFVRGRLAEVVNRPEEPGLAPVTLNFKPAQRLSAPELLHTEVMRRARRYLKLLSNAA